MSLPLHNICELEPLSDVVCDNGYKSLINDRKFHNFLMGYAGDFEEASKIERPMISLKVLESWRRERNGRFVKHDEDRNLWNDIGDKKSREYISKALKQISKSRSDVSNESDSQVHERTISSTSENTATTETSSQSSNLKSSTLMAVAPTPFADATNRRLSACIEQNSRKNDHLYGRSQEQSNLVALYEQSVSLDGLTNFLVLSGEPGTGKTALALSLRPTVMENNGFFAQAKFEQLEINDSLAAYISVFSDFCQRILDMKDYKLQNLHVEKIASLMEHLLDDTIAVSIVPALGEILSLASKKTLNNPNDSSPSIREELSKKGKDDKQRVSVHVSYSSARLKFCFSKILKSIVCKEFPLVVLLDDVQYASSTVSFRDFLTDLVDHKGLFFIATYRIGLGQKALSFDQLTSSLNQDVINLHHWELNGLTPAAVHELMADTLSSDLPRLEHLSSDLFYLTGGNVLFLLELLRSFQDDGILKYDNESNQWICDNHLLSHHPSMQVHSLGDLYQAKIAELPIPVQDTLKIAAVLGPSSSKDIVYKVSKHTQVADAFATAIKAGLVFNKGDDIISFRHDSIHTAAYNLIPNDEKSMFALTLGRRLWRRAGEKDINKYTADIVGLMYRGRDELVKKSSPADLAAVALLCLQASKLAGKSGGFHSSIFFVDFGIYLLEHAGKWKDNYDLCMSLHNNAVDVHYGVGQFSKVEDLVDEVLKNARCFGDTVQARMMKVYTLGTTKKLVEALDYGVETLALLEEPIPAFPTNVQVALAMTRTKRRLKKKSDASLLRIPTLTDQKKIEVMMALQIMFLNAYFARPSLAVLICCRIIDITLEHGACAVSSVGFAGYAVVAARGGVNYEEGYKFGQNALAFAQKFGGDVWKCRTAAAVYGCINIWKEPLLPCLSEMKKAYLLGLGSGDIEYAVLNASLYIWNCFGYIPLDQLELSIRTLFERMTVLQQTGSLLTLKPVWQMCQNFMGRNHNPKYLLGEALTRADLEDSTCSDNHYELRSSIGSDEMLMAYHFSDFEMAEARLPSAIILYTSVSTMSAANARMYHALILLATAKQNSWSRIRKVKRLLKQMRKWSKSCPQNYLGRQFLVEAELARVQKKVEKAHSKYYLAVIQFRDHGCLLFEALANERAGKFCASIGDKDKANQYLDEALKVYNTWGALGKCEHLKEEMQTSIMCLTCNNN